MKKKNRPSPSRVLKERSQSQTSALFIAILALSGCETPVTPPQQPTSPLRLVGRISYGEPSGCASAVDSQDTNWTQCHQFKRHFDPLTGQPLTEARYITEALRPLPANVEFNVYKSSDRNTPCGTVRIQTSLDGTYNTAVPGCAPGDSLAITAKVLLQYQMIPATGPARTIRGVWREDQALPLFPSFGAEVNQSYGFSRIDAGISHRYSIPQLGFTATATQGSPTAPDQPFEINLGNRVFLGSGDADTFGYMRQLLSAFGTMVELHDRLRAMLSGAETSLDYFTHMFVLEPASGWANSYTVWFDNTWAYGWHGGIAMFRPDYDRFRQDGGSGPVTRLLSGVDTLSHEFGHSVHAGFAPSSFASDYSFANPLRRASGPTPNYDWGHGGGQYQETGVAFVEGIANTIGQYLVNACNGWRPERRPIGGVDPFRNNMWNGDASCDSTDGCGFHHIRWHLASRGIAENSAAWNQRLGFLRNLTAWADQNGHRFVTSNTEARYGEFGCDLLDASSDVSYAAGRLSGQRYVPDFSYFVGEALDGRMPNPVLHAYASDPQPETAQIGMPSLLKAMSEFCPGCSTMARPQQWGPVYNTQRLSATQGLQSPQALVRHLRNRGLLSQDQVENLLKSNFLEEI